MARMTRAKPGMGDFSTRMGHDEPVKFLTTGALCKAW